MLKLVKRPKSHFWIARGTINGRRITKSTGCSKKAEAERALQKIIADETGDFIGQRGLTLDQAAAIYLDQGGCDRYLGKILNHFDGMCIADITKAEMRKASNILYPKAAPATVRRQLYTPVKAIINCAAEEDLCTPKTFKSPSNGKRRTDFLLPDQAERLIQACKSEGPYLTAMVTMFLGQGVRLSEAIRLQAPDVSLSHRFAILRDTKNGEERQISLIPRVVAALSVLPTINSSDTVFRSATGNPYPIKGRGVQKPFKRAVIASGIKESTSPHILRHTWATWFYAQTRDVLRLKVEGGWKSSEWERYTKTSAPMLGQDAFEKGWDYSETGEKWETRNDYLYNSMS